MALQFLDLLLHVDKYIGLFLQNYGILTYAILFLIIFLETGIVFFPFLPGDSLLFAAGTFSAQGLLNPFILFIILCVAAIIGDSINYFIGKYFGEKIIRKSKLVREEYLDKTKSFYDKYGGIAIIYARFVPIIRTFAPFIAGMSSMNYKKFLSFNILGALAWVGIFVWGGFFLGNILWVKNNLELIIYIIIIVSLIPPIAQWIKIRKKK